MSLDDIDGIPVEPAPDPEPDVPANDAELSLRLRRELHAAGAVVWFADEAFASSDEDAHERYDEPVEPAKTDVPDEPTEEPA